MRTIIPKKIFFYRLPENYVAQYPLTERDQARLMIVDRTKKTIRHDRFYNVDEYLPENSVLVFNDSKVIPARLWGQRQKTKGKVEIFLLKKLSDPFCYQALLRPRKRLKENEEIIFNGGAVVATIVDKDNQIVRFNRKNIASFLRRSGHVPLPPYIRRPDESVDRSYYQTVYAKHAGSVAAPTAGLHFTKSLLERLSQTHPLFYVTLHVNFGTFQLVKEENIVDHKMHAEDYAINPQSFQTVCSAKKKGQSVVCVGTTSCRVLETAAQTKKRKGQTDIFIYPGYRFQLTDHLITNFHLPCSSLLMLVHAFGGKTLMKKAYREAIKNNYRFYSYGDAMLIL